MLFHADACRRTVATTTTTTNLPAHTRAPHTENTSTINQQKRKLSRQHDVLLNLKGKYARSDGRACDENSKLTEEYKRITEHFKDMQVIGCGCVWEGGVLSCEHTPV